MHSATTDGQAPVAPVEVPATALGNEAGSATPATSDSGEPPLKKTKVEDSSASNGKVDNYKRGVAPIKAEYV